MSNILQHTWISSKFTSAFSCHSWNVLLNRWKPMIFINRNVTHSNQAETGHWFKNAQVNFIFSLALWNHKYVNFSAKAKIARPCIPQERNGLIMAPPNSQSRRKVLMHEWKKQRTLTHYFRLTKNTPESKKKKQKKNTRIEIGYNSFWKDSRENIWHRGTLTGVSLVNNIHHG